MKFVKVLGFVIFLTTFYILHTTYVYAQECTNVSNSEFHSLRPYPAKSCLTTTENYAKFCGNTLTLQSSIEVPYTPGVDDCVPIDGGKVRCSYVEQGGDHITIDLKNANLPIMGNTEEVINSQNPINANNPDDKNNNMSPEQRVNDYVSWYLNGIFNRAEYSPVFFPAPTNMPSLTDFSGPINKLLPQEVAQQERAQTVKNATITRHDQIVGCTFGYKIPILGTEVGGYPIPCYIDAGFPGNIFLGIYIQKWRLSDWVNKGRLPPIRSNFPNYTDYYIKYREWRGDKCLAVTIPSNFLGINIPLVGGMTVMLCGDDPLNPNFWSNLYNYIPLSSTEDLEGGIKVGSVSVGGAGVSNITFSNQNPAKLFFPHIQESDELGSILQDTYLAKDEAKTGPDVAVEPVSSCTTVDVRSNKGDSLHAGEIVGDLSYTASFTCDFTPPTCSGNPLPPSNTFCETEYTGSCVPLNWGCTSTFLNAGCRTGFKCGYNCTCDNPAQSCTKTFPVTLSTLLNAPKIDDVWSRLVAGPTAVVKRMFPKLGSQIGTLKDLPGSTSITYSGGTETTGQLNFPHIGGISEYFLKGIQTLLRPKGFGEPISFGEIKSQASCSSGTLPELPAATENACKICNKPSTLPQIMVDILEAAAQAYNVPASVIYGTFMHEGGDHYSWNDTNAMEWSLCGGEVPNCDKNGTTAQAPYGWFPVYFYDFGYWDAVKAIDPDRTMENTSPCNFLDATFATAKALSEWSSGLPLGTKFTIEQDPSQTYSKFPDICLGYDVNNGASRPSSCTSWNANTVVTSQIGYGGWCPEPGKHPIQPYFPDLSFWITSTVDSYNNYTCR